jgi:hypothetical protein
MIKSKAHVRRLAINREIIRTLRGRELAEVAAGWECSSKTSGNIACSPDMSGDPDICESAKSR